MSNMNNISDVNNISFHDIKIGFGIGTMVITIILFFQLYYSSIIYLLFNYVISKYLFKNLYEISFIESNILVFIFMNIKYLYNNK